jgi:hypothetical protein
VELIFTANNFSTLAAVEAKIVVGCLVQASAVVRAGHLAQGRVFFAAGIHLDELGEPVGHEG